MSASQVEHQTLRETIALLEAALRSLQALTNTDACPKCGRPLTIPPISADVVNLNSVCKYCQPVAPITEIPAQPFET